MNNPSELQHCTTSLIAAATEFQALLLEELEAIAESRHDNLPDLTSRKLACAEHLSQLESRRQRVLRALGVADTDDPMATAVRHDPNAEQLRTAWQSAREKLDACRELNRQIGNTLRAQAAYTRQALGILSAELATPVSYDAVGGSDVHCPARNLGTA